MSRTARAQDGFVSTLLRERSRARRRTVTVPRPGGPVVPETSTEPRTALLVMDMQNAIVGRFGDTAVLDRAAEAVAAARTAGVPVIHVRVGFRAGYPEVSSRNKAFTGLRDAAGGLDDPEATSIHPAVAPRDHEVVVTKRRVSAFAGSDLDVVLRAAGIEALVLCGVATSGVVLSTLRAAADLDFRLTVLRDACADRDEEVHRVLTEKVFPRQADVLDVAAWTAAVGAAARA
jgi:nicotinamidase-related amidase